MKIPRRKTLSSILLLTLVFSGLLVATPVQAAATLYLAPSSGSFAIGQNFTVGIKVNSGGDVINAAEGAITYDTALLSVVSVSKGASIFPFWTTEPGVDSSTIRFGGGLPPPAYNGSAGHLISITFRAKAAGEARVAFTAGAVLANDGKGTNILGSMGSASYTLSPTVTPPPKKPSQPAEPEYIKPKITSPTHPDQDRWYNIRTAKFVWAPPGDVNGISIGFDDRAVTDPGPVADGLFGEKEYTVEADGVYYLHLKYKDSRRWGTIAHYRIMVDTTPPLPFEIEVKQLDISDWPELHFETIDEESGLAKYEVFIDTLEREPFAVSAEENIFRVSDVSTGEHTAMVKAIDKAGNERVSTIQFNVMAMAAPIIKNYSKELKSSENFFVNGTAEAGGKVNIYITQNGSQVAVGEAIVDASGNWFYVHDQELDNGRYVFWAEAENEKGIRSLPSEKLTFLVSPPIFAIIGSVVINYFTVMVSLIFMIILIILAILYLIGLIRRKLKKETVEIEEVLHRNALEMKKSIDQEFIAFTKSPSKAGFNKAKDNLKKKVDDNEKKTLKEIQDVEEILK